MSSTKGENIIRSYRSEQLPTLLFVPGFGDDSSVFEPLAATALASHYRLSIVDFPGFGGAPCVEQPTTLESFADLVHNIADQQQACVVVAHSAGSIIASLAAGRASSTIDTIISLEGNLTAEDAYFSGTAADYNTAADFRRAFLSRLDAMAQAQPIIARYRSAVAKADPQSLWELGCDVHRFSLATVPGDVLTETSNAYYLYNPANCPDSSIEWLRDHSISAVQMNGASHWFSADQPHLLADKILETLGKY